MSTLTTEKAGSSLSLNSDADKSPSSSTLDSAASPAVQKKNKEKQKHPKKGFIWSSLIDFENFKTIKSIYLTTNHERYKFCKDSYRYTGDSEGA